jgi:hypothetical protein
MHSRFGETCTISEVPHHLIFLDAGELSRLNRFLVRLNRGLAGFFCSLASPVQCFFGLNQRLDLVF